MSSKVYASQQTITNTQNTNEPNVCAGINPKSSYIPQSINRTNQTMPVLPNPNPNFQHTLPAANSASNYPIHQPIRPQGGEKGQATPSEPPPTLDA
jgi:hypothetical protein